MLGRRWEIFSTEGVKGTTAQQKLVVNCYHFIEVQESAKEQGSEHNEPIRWLTRIRDGRDHSVNGQSSETVNTDCTFPLSSVANCINL